MQLGILVQTTELYSKYLMNRQCPSDNRRLVVIVTR